MKTKLDQFYWPAPRNRNEELGWWLANDVLWRLYGMFKRSPEDKQSLVGDMHPWHVAWIKIYVDNDTRDFNTVVNDQKGMCNDARYAYVKDLARKYVRKIGCEDYFTAGTDKDLCWAGADDHKNAAEIRGLMFPDYQDVVTYALNYLDTRIENYKGQAKRLLGIPEKEIKKIERQKKKDRCHVITVKDLYERLGKIMKAYPKLKKAPVNLEITTYYGSIHEYGICAGDKMIVADQNSFGTIGLRRSSIHGDL